MSDRTVRLAGTVALMLASLAAIAIVLTRPFGYDFAAYWSAARRLLDGEVLYPLAHRPDPFVGFGEFLYEPLVAVAFVPLARIDFAIIATIWTIGEAAIGVGLALTLARRFAAPLRPWVAAATVVFLPLIAEVTLGQLNLITLVVCLLVWRLRERPAAAGILLMIATGLKLLPLALLVFFLFNGRIRLLLWSAGSGLALIALSLPFLGAQWLDYLSLLLTLAAVPAAQAINIVPALLASGALRLVLPLAAIGIAAWCGWRGRTGDGYGPFVTALAVAPFVSPTVWYPYLVFTLPLLALLVSRGRLLLAGLLWLGLEVPSGRGPLPDLAFWTTMVLIGIALFTALRAARPWPEGTATAS